MLDIISDGKEYISASRASEKVGYSSDYIGQLCRAQKIPGKLLGRTWYVDFEALIEHKNNKKAVLASKNRGKEIDFLSTEVFSSENLSDAHTVVLRDARQINTLPAVPETEAFYLFPPLSKKNKYVPPVFTSRLLRDASVVTLSMILMIGVGFGAVEKNNPSITRAAQENLENISGVSKHLFANLSPDLIKRSVSDTQVAAVSFFDSFQNLKDLALKKFFFTTTPVEPKIPSLHQQVAGSDEKGISGSTSPSSSMAITPLNVPQKETSGELAKQALATTPSLDLSSLKSDLRTELQSYILANIPKATSPIILRQEILLADTRPSITNQSSSDTSHLSAVLNSSLNSLTTGGIFTDSVLNNATVSGTGSFSTLSWTNATGTNLRLEGNLTVAGDTTTVGQLLSTRIPTLAHIFTTWPSGTSNASDATIYINPASAGADTNILAAAVGGSVKFLVDAEGDIYGNNLVLTGSTSQGATTIAGNLTVQDHTFLGDAPTDNITVNGRFASDLVPATNNTYNLGTTTNQWKNLYLAGNSTTTNATTTNFFSTTASSTNLFAVTGNIGSLTAATLCLSGTCNTAWPSTFDFTPTTYGVSTSTTLGLLNGFFTTASSTLTKFTYQTATGTSATSTNFFATTASSTNLFAQSGSIGSLTAASLCLSGTCNTAWPASASSKWATSTDLVSISPAGATYVGIGTTTPVYALTVSSSTAPQLSLSAGAGFAQWAFRNAGGNLYFATTTVAGNATTSTSALTILSSGRVGIGTSTPTTGFSVYDPTLHVYNGTNNPTRVFVGGKGSAEYGIYSGGRTETTQGNSLAQFTGVNYQNSTWQNSAAIFLEADTGVGGGATDAPGRINFLTTPNASETLTSRMILDSSGQLTLTSTNAGGDQVIYFNDTNGYVQRNDVGQGTDSMQVNGMYNLKLTLSGTSGGNVFTGTNFFGPEANNTTNLGDGSHMWGAAYVLSGVWTGSDSRLKHNILGSDLGLEFIKNLRPTSYQLNSESSGKHYGLIAQEVEQIAPQDSKFVHDPGDGGYLTVNYSEFTSPIIKAIQELNLNLESIAGIASSTTSESFTSSFFTNLFSKVTTWLADATNGIGDFFANRVRTKELCVSDSAGETCLTRSQIDSLIAGAASSGGSSGSGVGDTPPAPTDLCDNIEGIQETVPEDLIQDGSSCVTPIPELPPADEPPPEAPSETP